MKNTVPDINKITQLQFLFGQLWDENFKLRGKAIYDSKIKSFNDELKLIGIDPKLAPKEIELKLQQFYELLTKVPKFKDANKPNDTIKEAPRPQGQTATTLTPEQIQNFTEQQENIQRQKNIIEVREKQVVQDYIGAQQKIREQIVKTQSIQEEIKDKKIYAKIEVDQKEVIQENQLKPEEVEKIKHYEALIEEGKLETATQELALEIEQKAEAELIKKGITETEAKAVAVETARQAIEELSHKNEVDYIPPSYQTAIIATVAVDKSVLPKVVSSKTAEELVKASANNVTVFRIQPEVLTRSILTTALGERFSTFVLGVDPSKVKIVLTETIPQNLNQTQLFEYKEVNLQAISSHGIDIQEGQINVLDKLSGRGREIAVNFVQSNVVNYFSRQIEKLPAGSVVKKVVSTPEMQAIFFAKFGIGNPVTWQYMNPALMRVMGQSQLAGAFFSAVGKATGKEIVKPVVGAVVSKVGTQAAGKVAGGSIGATIGALTGLSGGPLAIVTAAVGYVVGEVFSKALSKLKVWWTEHKDDTKLFFAIGAGGLGLMIGGPVAGVFGLGLGLATTGTLGLFAAGMFNIFGVIGRSVGIAIATPVIVTLLVLPPLVAFIMLVINNSAYVVPPAPVAESGFGPGGSGFVCTTEKSPTSITASSNSPIATRAWEIMEDMYQGFWCFWNRSPGDFPTDIVTPAYTPHYPELFNEKLFAKIPNPTRDEVSSCGECLFWCTWLVQKSYKENGISILYTLWSPSMYTDFESRGKILEVQDETFENIKPGAVVFFDVDNGLNRIDHVGVVHSVNAGGVTFLQSNAGTKDDFIPFGSNGLQDLPGITVVGIGNP